MKDFSKFPNTRNPKWGSMDAGNSHLSDEWHDMDASSPKTSEKWVDQVASSPRTSEKFVEMNAGESQFSDKFHSMEQTKRKDPYASMVPQFEDRTVGMKQMSKEKPDNKVGRATQHNEFGSTREI